MFMSANYSNKSRAAGSEMEDGNYFKETMNKIIHRKVTIYQGFFLRL